jgi:hypothetical protein
MSKRIFISYSHDSGAHVQRVLALTMQLRTQGLDAQLDQYARNPAEGWPRWMTRQIIEADFVLLVCTPTYRRRFDGEENSSAGQGATWEGLIAQQILYEAGGLNHKLIPVLFEDGDERDIPLSLRPFTHYRLDEGYEDLYRHLTGQPKHVAPPLGHIVDLRSLSRPGFLRRDVGETAPGGSFKSSSKASAARSVAPPRKSQILLFTANSTGPRLQLEEELRAIDDALQRSRLRDSFDLRIAPAVTFEKVIAELDDHSPEIVHFGGHGSDDGEIMFSGQTVPPKQMADLFHVLRKRPKLVVFSLCHSRALAEAAALHVEHAIGFDGPVEDSTTRVFAATLYERLASHERMDVAYAFLLARLAAIAAGHDDAERAKLCP